MTQRPMAMSNQGFFGSIFESPDEDPLLHSDDRASDPQASDDRTADDFASNRSARNDRRSGDQREDEWRDDDWMNDDAFSGDGATYGNDASYGSDTTFYDDLYGDTAERGGAASDNFEETDVQDVYVALDDAQSSLQTLNAAVDDGWRMTHVDLVGSGAFASGSQVVITIERSHPRSLFDFGPGG